MAKPSKPKKPAARRAPLRASTRGESTENSSEPDADSGDEDEVVDTALLAFVCAPALGADRLQVLALSPSGDAAVIQDRQAAEAKRIPEPLAIAIEAACERYAATEKRAVRFRAAWMRGEKTLATYTWESGSGKVERELDGSVQSFLQQQQVQQLAQHKLHLEGFEMVQESWKSLLTLQNKRIEALEKDNAELRDRLRKMDDVGSEIAIEQMRAEVEARSRTADLVEKRLLPIAQALAVKHLESSAAASKHEQGNNEKPSA